MRTIKENTIAKEAKKQFKEKQFYRIHMINNLWVTENARRCSDVMAEWIYNKSADEQKQLLLLNSHMTEPEKWTSTPLKEERGEIIIKDTNRHEENIAKRIMQISDSISIIDNFNTKVIDYQVPINRVNHSSEGKADLILVNQNETIIGELKGTKSSETLLRAMIEARTYQLKVESYLYVKDRFKRCYKCDNIKAAVLMFEGTQPWNDYESMKNTYTEKLAQQWDMLFFKVVRIGSEEEKIRNLDFEIKRL